MTRKPARRTRGKPDDVDRHVGRRLRNRRRLVGMSQTDLGNAINVTFQQVQKYENGSNRIGAGKLWQFCQALGVAPNYLFEGLEGAPESGVPDIPEQISGFSRMSPTVQDSIKKLVRAIDRGAAETYAPAER